MPRSDLERLSATFVHPIYSPRGGIEGLLADVDGRLVQMAFHHDPKLAETVSRCSEGAAILLQAQPQPPGEKGEGAYPVYRLVAVELDVGAPDGAGEDEAETAGTVVRLNYALHGEPNGVVLDNGDFVHVRPDGMRELGLLPGERVAARGPARSLQFGGGRVIEATRVNGHALGRKPRRRPEPPAARDPKRTPSAKRPAAGA